jgi:hypothetical protein
LIYRFSSDTDQNEVYNALKIEVQLRSKPQNACATGVETVGTFNPGEGQSSLIKVDKGLLPEYLIASVLAGPNIPLTLSQPRLRLPERSSRVFSLQPSAFSIQPIFFIAFDC